MRILHAIFTGGKPTTSTGGPNHIIYAIVEGSRDRNKYSYKSCDFYFEDLSDIQNSDYHQNLSRKIGSKLYSTINFYKRLTSNSIYQLFHIWKKQSEYNNKFKSNLIFDAIHCHDSITMAFVPDSFRGKRITTVHSKGPLSEEILSLIKSSFVRSKILKILQRIEKLAIRNSDIITFPSQAAFEMFNKYYEKELSRKNIKIIYNGIDIKKIQETKADLPKSVSEFLSRNDDGIIILNVAQKIPEKNTINLISALAAIRGSYKLNCRLISIGDGPLFDECKNMVDDLNLSEDVLLLRSVLNEEVIEIMRKCDLLVQPSSKVVFDIVILEALACGLHVLTSCEGGNREIIEENVNGYYLIGTRSDEIARSIWNISQLANLKEKRNPFVKYTTQSMLKEYLEIYEEETYRNEK